MKRKKNPLTASSQDNQIFGEVIFLTEQGMCIKLLSLKYAPKREKIGGINHSGEYVVELQVRN
jgi:hypothetical protein